jgi:hypothetical protein
VLVVDCWAVKAGVVEQVKVRFTACPRGGWLEVVRFVQKGVRAGCFGLLLVRVIVGIVRRVPRRRRVRGRKVCFMIRVVAACYLLKLCGVELD